MKQTTKSKKSGRERKSNKQRERERERRKNSNIEKRKKKRYFEQGKKESLIEKWISHQMMVYFMCEVSFFSFLFLAFSFLDFFSDFFSEWKEKVRKCVGRKRCSTYILMFGRGRDQG